MLPWSRTDLAGGVQRARNCERRNAEGVVDSKCNGGGYLSIRFVGLNIVKSRVGLCIQRLCCVGSGIPSISRSLQIAVCLTKYSATLTASLS